MLCGLFFAHEYGIIKRLISSGIELKIWHSVKICSMPVRRGTAMVDRVKGVEKVTDNPFLNSL